MTKVNDGGPAFPRAEMAYGDKGWEPDYFLPGMTLRQWYAGQTLMGLIARGGAFPVEENVRYAFRHADAMIKFEENENGNAV